MKLLEKSLFSSVVKLMLYVFRSATDKLIKTFCVCAKTIALLNFP